MNQECMGHFVQVNQGDMFPSLYYRCLRNGVFYKAPDNNISHCSGCGRKISTHQVLSRVTYEKPHKYIMLPELGEVTFTEAQ